MKAFISYAHVDETAVETLHKHLAMLKRSGEIETWYDRDIVAGGEFGKIISGELAGSKIFLAMVSPDFIDSNYCYEKEMTKAFEAHERGKIYIIPIILEPCDWQSSPLGKLKAIPKDGKAISEWTNENTAWLDVVNEIRRVVLDNEGTEAVSANDPLGAKAASDRKYRVKRDFDSIDKSDFREHAFAVIRDYFQEAIAELDGLEGMKARFRRMSDIAFSCSVYNRMTADGEAHITVRVGGAQSYMGDISYSNSENDTGNTANGWFSVESDDYELYLTVSLLADYSQGAADRLLPKGAAQILWQDFIKNAGVSYG